ncbi:MAG: thermonuclease family protein, partial [Desulfosoma sp.]|uniref:thermonuclease family protein n=1 Tax=Desulfosoma sp. TaxID=2603217 RepID=UPI00404B7487
MRCWWKRPGAVLRAIAAMACLVTAMDSHRVSFGEGAGILGFSKNATPPTAAVVVKVLDGDTVVLKGGFRVRYLGVDAPEMDHERGRHDCYAVEAFERNKAMVLGQVVTLSYEGHPWDDHGRLLAYVMTGDGTCVNAQLIREGLAYVFLGPEGFSRVDEFVKLQREAVLERRGLYGYCPVSEETRYVGNARTFIFHRPNCPYGVQVHARHRLEFSSRWEALERGFRPCRR